MPIGMMSTIIANSIQIVIQHATILGSEPVIRHNSLQTGDYFVQLRLVVLAFSASLPCNSETCSLVRADAGTHRIRQKPMPVRDPDRPGFFRTDAFASYLP